MKHALGIGAATLLVIAVNLLVATQDFFSAAVLGPLVIALVALVVWLLLLARSAAGYEMLQGRALGGFTAVVSSIFFLGICIVIYALFARIDVSWDLTQEGRRELSEQTKQVLRNLNREVTVTCFFTENDDDLIVIGKEKTLRFLQQCARHTNNLKIEVEDPARAVARMQAMEINFASPQGTIVVHTGTRKKMITLSGGSPRLEEREFTNALINVVRGSEPKVYFLSGHDERDIGDTESERGAGLLVEVLHRESYQADRLIIDLTNASIPPDCDVLVINNPAGDLHPREIAALDDYVDRGGRLFLLLDPWVRLTPGTVEQLRPWLTERFGIVVGSDIVLSQEKEKSYEVQLGVDSRPYEETDEGFGLYHGSYLIEHPVTRGFDQTMMLQANRTVSAGEEAPSNVVLSELLRTTPDFWAESDVASLRDRGAVKQDDGEPGGPLPLAVSAVGLTEVPVSDGGAQKKQSRVIVIGDSDFASNGLLTYPGHINFVLNAFAWLSESEELIAIRPTDKTDPPLVLSETERRAVAWISTLFTTQTVIAAGLLVFLWRRRLQ